MTSQSKSLNICIVTRITSYHSFGGMQHYVDLLAKGLAQRGNRIHIITTSVSRHDKTQTIHQGAITTHFIKNTRPGSYRKNFFGKAYEKFLEINSSDKIDIVHGQSASALSFAGKLDIPVVTTLFGVGYCETPYRKLIFPHLEFSQKLKHLWKLPKIAVSINLMRKTALKSDKTIFISRFAEREMLRISPSFPKHKMAVIPCGIETVNFDLKTKDSLKTQLGLKKPVVLSAGRIEFQKGFHLLLMAWRKICRQDAQLIIIGEGSYLNRLKKLADKLGISNCTFMGKLPHDEFLKYFGAADVFVYPELTQPAFGLVSAQAMAHGTPVIGSDHGAIPEVIADAGLVFKPGSVDDLADKLRYYLDHEEIWDYLAQKSQLRVKCFFTESNMVKWTLGLYLELIKKKRKSV